METFDSLEGATIVMSEILYGQATLDCEGRYIHGLPKYTEDFMVDGVAYTARMDFEYFLEGGYYDIDHYEFSYAVKEPNGTT